MSNRILIPYQEGDSLSIIDWTMDQGALWLLTKEPQSDGSIGRLNSGHKSTQCRVLIDGFWEDEWLGNLIAQPALWQDEG